jgi:hypothetical protein
MKFFTDDSLSTDTIHDLMTAYYENFHTAAIWFIGEGQRDT